MFDLAQAPPCMVFSITVWIAKGGNYRIHNEFQQQWEEVQKDVQQAYYLAQKPNEHR
jgi:L-rhamnose isomerase